MFVKNVLIVIIMLAISCDGRWSSFNDGQRKSRALLDILDTFHYEDVTFLLYTSSDGVAEELKIDEDLSITRSKFNSSNLTKIMTHGWQDDANADFMVKFKKAFLKYGQYNYISVDWTKCAFKGYLESLFCIQTVGYCIGLLIEKLAQIAHLKLDDVHLLGHSLGAHTMGYVSRKYKNKEIGRITGLDPASPVFELAGPSYSLDPSDAKVVDVIHTGLDTFGLRKPVGTVNFYPNGGQNQPGCNPKDTYDEDCNHASSYLFFVETIPAENRNKYIANKCKTLEDALGERCNGKQGVMGLDADKTAPGIYYIRVDEPPRSVV